MKPVPLPSRSRLQELLRYEPETGHLYWLTRRSGVNITKPAGSVNNKDKHVQITIDGTSYLAHRVIWKLVTGEEPPLLDHKDQDPKNNRWENLRVANKSQNGANAKGRGKYPRGVARNGKGFMAMIHPKGQVIYLGTFPTVEEASNAYQEAAKIHYGDFANPLDLERICI